MSIPSQQIETWSNQGSITTSRVTYTSIKTALTRQSSPIADMILSGVIKIGLQGSYAHDTNVYGDSDVDVVIQHTNTFHSNKLNLPVPQYQQHEQDHFLATYDWPDLRRDVIIALVQHYGVTNVDTTGKKSIKVLPTAGRLRIDVVPAITYKKYAYYYSLGNHSKEHGIAFKHTETNEYIVNYPDQHYDNAVAKQAVTNDRYKSLVRIFKNMRSYLIQKGQLTKEEAPSYFIQGMVYNIPPSLFVTDKATTTLHALRWLRTANLSSLISQNGQHSLLGNTAEYWNPTNAQKTVMELCFLWDNWGRI